MTNLYEEIIVTKMTDVDLARLCIASTTKGDVEINAKLSDIYRWEHSPLRSQIFCITMICIPTFVSVHLVRHAATGQQHYVQSNRSDRGGENADRYTPINHTMILNAQHLIDMSRRRLCYKASMETQSIWTDIRARISKIDPDLANYMVPNCIYRGGYCPEPKSCGNFIVKRYNPAKIYADTRVQASINVQ